MDYSNHVGIIGSGISGLTLGCCLLKFGIECVIFEKSNEISEHGAGISISRNALKILDRLDLINSFKEKSFQPKKVSWNYKNFEFHTTESDVFTANRKNLIKVLNEKYINLGGKTLFNHEAKGVNSNGKSLNFDNNDNLNIKHIAVCDGIKSSIRDRYFIKKNDIQYSGFNAWRGIGKSKNTKIQFHLGSKSHVVNYPINNELDQSFIGIVKNNKENTESWVTEGSLENLLFELNDEAKTIKSVLSKDQKIFKWGIFVRPPLKKIFLDNMTLLGDAAHPMVPFLGQGGCMAIEDAYTFALVLKKVNLNFNLAQKIYNKIRTSRNSKIQKMSMQQARLNHIENHFIALTRNFIMKNTKIISRRTNILWNYDAHYQIESELKKL